MTPEQHQNEGNEGAARKRPLNPLACKHLPGPPSPLMKISGPIEAVLWEFLSNESNLDLR